MDTAEEFLVRDDELYLLDQMHKNAFNLAMCIGKEEWPIRRLQGLRDRRTDLERHWPDPERSNLGVAWIEE